MTSCIWATRAYVASPLNVSDELAKSSLLRQHTDHVRIYVGNRRSIKNQSS